MITEWDWTTLSDLMDCQRMFYYRHIKNWVTNMQNNQPVRFGAALARHLETGEDPQLLLPEPEYDSGRYSRQKLITFSDMRNNGPELQDFKIISRENKLSCKSHEQELDGGNIIEVKYCAKVDGVLQSPLDNGFWIEEDKTSARKLYQDTRDFFQYRHPQVSGQLWIGKKLWAENFSGVMLVYFDVLNTKMSVIPIPYCSDRVTNFRNMFGAETAKWYYSELNKLDQAKHNYISCMKYGRKCPFWTQCVHGLEWEGQINHWTPGEGYIDV